MDKLAKLREIIEINGWGITEFGYNDTPGWEISQPSPLGEDFSFEIVHNGDYKKAIEEISDYAESFDIDDHAKMWIEAQERVEGIPTSISSLVEDAKDIKEMLEDLSKDCNKLNRKFEKPFNESYEEYTKKSNESLSQTGIFYAFSNEQFEKNKTHKQADDNEYLSIGAGAYIHKSNKQKLDTYFNEILPQLKKEFTDEILIEDLIDYELSNYECYYTGNYLEAFDTVKSFYPNKEDEDLIDKIKEIYNYNMNKEEDYEL